MRSTFSHPNTSFGLIYICLCTMRVEIPFSNNRGESMYNLNRGSASPPRNRRRGSQCTTEIPKWSLPDGKQFPDGRLILRWCEKSGRRATQAFGRDSAFIGHDLRVRYAVEAPPNQHHLQHILLAFVGRWLFSSASLEISLMVITL